MLLLLLTLAFGETGYQRHEFEIGRLSPQAGATDVPRNASVFTRFGDDYGWSGALSAPDGTPLAVTHTLVGTPAGPISKWSVEGLLPAATEATWQATGPRADNDPDTVDEISFTTGDTTDLQAPPPPALTTTTLPIDGEEGDGSDSGDNGRVWVITFAPQADAAWIAAAIQIDGDTARCWTVDGQCTFFTRAVEADPPILTVTAGAFDLAGNRSPDAVFQVALDVPAPNPPDEDGVTDPPEAAGCGCGAAPAAGSLSMVALAFAALGVRRWSTTPRR